VNRILLAALSVSLLAPRPVRSQERGANALGELIAGLGVSARVLVIGAHPDDEDTRLITWLQRGHHVDVAYLSLTRGDGGQNLIGNELGEALGVIRTQELLAARRVDGARQYFTRAYDFGFTKSAEEAYTHWPHDALLNDVVTVVRAFRPQIIVSVFSGTPADGHGQHQIAGLLAREVFDAAADSVKFPASKTQGLPAWAPLKFYQSTSFFGSASTLTYNAGEYSPLLGRSYAEIAGESRSQHKSQGFGVFQRKGYSPGSVRREKVRAGVAAPADPSQEKSIFDGVDTTLGRLGEALQTAESRAKVDSVRQSLAAIQRSYDSSNPAGIVNELARESRLVESLWVTARCTEARCARRLAREDAETSGWSALERSYDALTAATGLAVEANAERDLVALGDSVPVKVTVYNRGTVPITVTELSVARARSAKLPGAAIAPDSSHVFEMKVVGDSISRPWWLERGRDGDMFVEPPETQDEGTRDRPPTVTVRFDVAHAHAQTNVPIVYRFADPVRGEVHRPLAIAPAISLTLARTVELAPANSPINRALRVHLRYAGTAPRTATVRLTLPAGLTADSASRTVSFAKFGAASDLDFYLRGQLPAGRHTIKVVAESGGQTFAQGYVPIEYEHIQPQRMYRPSALEVQSVGVKLPPGLTVAYIPGVGDNVAPMLEQLGVPLTVLDPSTLATTDLSKFTTVVIGTRAYESSPALVASNRKLLDWARQGGTMVVQYGQFEMATPGIMPYPVTLSRPAARVTVETAPVKILAPDDPLLTSPNKIGPKDFEDWVQERALYMPSTFAPNYKPLLGMNDPGEPENDAAILVAPLGRGTYVYTTLSLFRQLPAGNPGAAKLFANLLGAHQPGEAARP
jgi:LmbE family N-acetylglucosaminyl deacetylase